MQPRRSRPRPIRTSESSHLISPLAALALLFAAVAGLIVVLPRDARYQDEASLLLAVLQRTAIVWAGSQRTRERTSGGRRMEAWGRLGYALCAMLYVLARWFSGRRWLDVDVFVVHVCDVDAVVVRPRPVIRPGRRRYL